MSLSVASQINIFEHFFVNSASVNSIFALCKTRGPDTFSWIHKHIYKIVLYSSVFLIDFH